MQLFHTLAEGGQTWAHRVRMVRQVIKIALSFSFCVGLIYILYAFSCLDRQVLQGGYYNLKAKCFSPIRETVIVTDNFWKNAAYESKRSGKTVPTQRLLTITQPHMRTLLQEGRIIGMQSLYVACFTFCTMLLFFFVRGATAKKKQHISGRKQVPPYRLSLKLKLKRQASDLKIASVPLVKGTETRHIMLTGGTGSGKTNCFHHLLPQIRQRLQKAIIVDTTGIFLERYYTPKDILLNPFDDKGLPWHPWCECQSPFDYEDLAESFIPQSHNDQDNYWRTAARSLFSSILLKTSDLKLNSELSRWLLLERLSRVAAFVQGTKAAAHIDPSSEKTSASIRSVASSFLRCIEYLQDTSTPFSIKQWIADDSATNWLFLSCKPSQRAALNPLISCWFSIAARSLLHMTPDRSRRIWLIVDELPTLQKFKELETFITESRKYGGCGIFALQSPAQLESIYGRATTQTLIGNCATRIVFAEHDPEIAESISRSFGKCEVKEYQEGISYGAHEIRDGVNLTLQTKQQPTISASDIQSLKINHAYIKLAGDLPIACVKFKIVK